MADIGSTLRETRIRDKIDITVVEESTKIRAKYLRALENEEWNVMPGPTYVKSFLRTYAEFLGLDAHMLVEEYRARYEQPEELELPAFAEGRPLRRRVRAPGPPSRAAGVAALAIGFLVLLFILGITAGDEDNGGSSRSDQGQSATSSRAEKGNESGGGQAPTGAGQERPRPAPRQVRVSLVAARDVWVCMVNAKGDLVIEGRTVPGGEREGPFRSKRFRLTVGNGGADLRVNGRTRDLPESSAPQGYTITAAGLRELPESRRPTCEPGQAVS
jgi:hypothetical protein